MQAMLHDACSLHIQCENLLPQEPIPRGGVPNLLLSLLARSETRQTPGMFGSGRCDCWPLPAPRSLDPPDETWLLEAQVVHPKRSRTKQLVTRTQFGRVEVKMVTGVSV